jgi:hypothetical protein
MKTADFKRKPDIREDDLLYDFTQIKNIINWVEVKKKFGR